MRHTIIYSIILLCIFSTSCGRRMRKKKGNVKNGKEQAIPIRVETIETGLIAKYVEGSATVKAINHVKVSTQLKGDIIEIKHKEGEYVKKGDILAKINPQDYEIELEEAKHQLGELKDDLENQKIALKEAKHNKNTALITVDEYEEKLITEERRFLKVKNELERSLKMLKKNVISPESHESKILLLREAKASLNVAHLALKRSKLSLQNYSLGIEKAKLAIKKLRTRIKKAILSVKKARIRLRDTNIIAPITGTISFRDIQIGQEVTNGVHVFSIVDTENLEIQVGFSEKELLEVKKGQSVLISSETVPLREETKPQGYVDVLFPIVDENTGTVKVRIRIKKNYVKLFRSGTFVTVRIISQVYPHATLVPKKSLLFDDNIPFIFLLKKNRAKKVLLTSKYLGTKNTFYYQVFDVVKPGDKIIVVGQAGLKDNSIVSVVETPQNISHLPKK